MDYNEIGKQLIKLSNDILFASYEMKKALEELNSACDDLNNACDKHIESQGRLKECLDCGEYVEPRLVSSS